MAKDKEINLASMLKANPEVAAEFIATGVNIAADNLKNIPAQLEVAISHCRELNKRIQEEMARLAATTKDASIDKTIGNETTKFMDNTIKTALEQNQVSNSLVSEFAKLPFIQAPHTSEQKSGIENLASQISILEKEAGALNSSITNYLSLNQKLKAAVTLSADNKASMQREPESHETRKNAGYK